MLACLRSIAFYTVFYAGSVVLVLAAVPLALVSRQAVPVMALVWARFHRFCLRAFVGIDVEVHGQFPKGPALVAMKHESFFDPIDLPNVIDRPVVFAKAELLRIPVWGRLAVANGMIPVQREQGARALRTMLAAARTHAAGGRVLVIFPEGTRVPHGRRPRLRSGFAALYKALELPVVPVAIDSGPLYHRWCKRSGTISIRAAEPIPPGLSRKEIESRVHQAINALNAGDDAHCPRP
ncbi:MAG: 1-acyl-sn-glycerol-3-phosphate acyltransferase [Novosphingobium sp.]|nr:1-acyl-sn-glycerol-3-phosphate acyltransferase [Novosphingobium sp.]